MRPDPTLAPSTRASASGRLSTPAPASEITNRITATLEWASQVNRAPMASARTGSSARRSMTRVKTSGSRKGCDAPTISASDRIIRARPMTMRPICCQRLGLRRQGEADADDQQHGHEGGGLERERLHDEGRADIGAEHHGKRRRQRNEAALGEGDHQETGGGRALQGGRDAEPGQAGSRPPWEVASPMACRSFAPKARMTPFRTIWVAQTSRATPPRRFKEGCVRPSRSTSKRLLWGKSY